MTAIKKRKRDFYRPAFCDSSYYEDNLGNFQIISDWVSGYPPHRRLAVWVVACACLRRPFSWYSGIETISEISAEEVGPEKKILHLFRQLNISWPKHLNLDISVFDFCRRVRIKPLPRVAQRALFYFYAEVYRLVILPYEPTPYEVLEIQIEGRRVFTFQPDFQQWPLLRYGERDPLSFWIHDLIHAEHFFAVPENRQSQIGFYILIRHLLQNELLDHLHLNPDFESDFSYLISDMNSHPIHLLKTLRSLIDRFENKSARPIWDQILEFPFFSHRDDIVAALKKLNTPTFHDNDARQITHFLHLDLFQLSLP